MYMYVCVGIIGYLWAIWICSGQKKNLLKWTAWNGARFRSKNVWSNNNNNDHPKCEFYLLPVIFQRSGLIFSILILSFCLLFIVLLPVLKQFATIWWNRRKMCYFRNGNIIENKRNNFCRFWLSSVPCIDKN